MSNQHTIQHNETNICITGRHYRIFFNTSSGQIERISLFDGIRWQENILAEGQAVGHNWTLPVQSVDVIDETPNCATIRVIQQSQAWRLACEYEVFFRGYVICSFSLEALQDQAVGEQLRVGITLDNATVLSHNHSFRNHQFPQPPSQRPPTAYRAISVNFSTDDRPVTNSVDFLLESVTQGTKTNGCDKMFEQDDTKTFLGWDLSIGQSHSPYPKGFRYENRWCLSLSAADNSPNKVRGQRIYTYYGWYPPYPSKDVLDEMAEYGCSILHLHNWSRHISGGEPIDEERFRETVDYAHELGMKVVFYCQPYLLSINAPYHKELADSRTECLRIWHAMANTQIVTYTPFEDWDCDELCLGSKKAYRFIRDTVIETWKKYGFDGLYIDFAWPAQGLCNDTSHGHAPGLFGFYDYLRLLREWRNAIGPDQIMIGHGGGYLVSSDMGEAFDACLTGEAQVGLNPVTLGQSFGPAPTVWTMHRRKVDEFRSWKTIEELIREGATPHTPVGIMGTSVLATVDPAHHVELMALWQMWRAFPVHRGTFYNYLSEKVIDLDNPEVVYSLFVTPEKHVLLLLANRGGEITDRSPAVGVNAQLDTKKLELPNTMNCWRMKGNTYETFRISQAGPVQDGVVSVPEIGKHEFVGFVLSPDAPPDELTILQEHLAGRWDRLPAIMRAKQKRLAEFDETIENFAKLPHASQKLNYQEFMKDRVAE